MTSDTTGQIDGACTEGQRQIASQAAQPCAEYVNAFCRQYIAAAACGSNQFGWRLPLRDAAAQLAQTGVLSVIKPGPDRIRSLSIWVYRREADATRPAPVRWNQSQGGVPCFAGQHRRLSTRQVYRHAQTGSWTEHHGWARCYLLGITADQVQRIGLGMRHRLSDGDKVVDQLQRLHA